MPTSFAELIDALEIASLSNSGECQAFVCRQSGKIYCRMDPLYVGELDEELPDDLDDDEKYVQVPDKRALDLGKPLVMDFTRAVLPQDLDDVRDMFRKREAYAKFKGLLARRRALDRWYDFEREATERALRVWCELNSIELVD
ncbi:MAG: hypothetical protein GEV13_20410 [Rhodospirillales bacterium]|nr:hypothetical protein [Rhodospirillales bacterium]